MKPMLLSSIFEGLAKDNLQNSLDKLRNLKNTETTTALLGITSILETKEDYSTFIKSASGMDNESKIMESAIQKWALKDPASASEWVGYIKNERERVMTSLNVLQSWLSSDSKNAIQWYKNYNNNSDEAMKNIAWKWAQVNPVKASEWIVKENLSDKQDVVLKFVDSVRWTHPEIASKWVSKIKDKKARGERVENIYISLKAEDSEKAESFLENSSFVEKIRRKYNLK